MAGLCEYQERGPWDGSDGEVINHTKEVEKVEMVGGIGGWDFAKRKPTEAIITVS